MKAVLLILGALTLSAQALTLVRDGKAEATIIVPDEVLKATKNSTAQLFESKATVALAVVELADYIEKISGAGLAIVGESSAAQVSTKHIYVGDCRATRELIKEPLKPEELLIRCTAEALHIVGGDSTKEGQRTRGTLFGVYDLLEQELGVRWLFPGELGEVVPKQKTIDLPALDRRMQPSVAKRKVRNVAVSRERTFKPVLAEWEIDMDAWTAAQGLEVSGPWFHRQRLGSRIEIEGGHSYAGFYAKYAKEHPDFFAMQPDGTRTQVPERERLCKSNPALWDFIAKLRIAELKADPSKLTISIAPNDGGKNKFCMCANCRALDPPNAPKLFNDNSLIDPATGKPFLEYPSLSDRTFTFFNEIAKRVRAEVPDRFLVCYAYSVYRTPPVNIAALEPNLIVGYVGLDLKAIDAWSKLAPQLMIRPNDLGPAIDLGMPRNHAVHLAKAVKFSVDHHAIGFDFDNCHGNWSSHGLDYYVLTKALWNPDIDPHGVIEDYCRAAYGKGSSAMLRYYDRLERLSDGVRTDPKLVARGDDATQLVQHYTPEALTELEAQLAAAKQAVGGDDAASLARIAMVEDSVHYARLLTALLEVSKEPKARKTKLYQERLAAVIECLKLKTLTRSLASLHSYRYLRIALSNADREVE